MQHIHVNVRNTFCDNNEIVSKNHKFYVKSGTLTIKDGNMVERRRVSLSHTHHYRKNSSSSPHPNPTTIKLLSHLYLHRVADIISYLYPYQFYYFNINFN